MKLIGYKKVFRTKHQYYYRIMFHNEDSNEFQGYNIKWVSKPNKLIVGKDYEITTSSFDDNEIINLIEINNEKEA